MPELNLFQILVLSPDQINLEELQEKVAHRGSERAEISGRDGYNPYYPPLAKGDEGGF